MKKTLLSLFTILGFAVNAQTLTQANHSFTVGDLYSTYPCSTVGVNSGATGAGSTWNYASVTSNTSTPLNYSTSVNTNTVYAAADILVDGGSNNKTYYKSSAFDLKYYGGDMSINGTPVTLGYTNPAIYAIYPMSLNSTTTSAISGSAVILGNNATFSGQCTILADASGTITLPSGNTYNNTLRVLTTQTITTSALPFVGVATIYMQNYDYYDPSAPLGFKASLFSISSSTLSSGAGTSAQTFVTVLKDNTAGVNETQKTKIDISVFPNPASNFINFSTSSLGAVKIIVFDLTGKALATEPMEMGKAKMNLNNLSSGVYMYHVVDKKNQILKADKFNISK